MVNTLKILSCLCNFDPFLHLINLRYTHHIYNQVTFRQVDASFLNSQDGASSFYSEIISYLNKYFDKIYQFTFFTSNVCSCL